MNIECDQVAHDELVSAFKFNDAVIRNMILRCDEAVTEASPLAKSDDAPAKEAPRKEAAPAAAPATETKDSAPESSSE
jgi:small subunit ribosomal protein S6